MKRLYLCFIALILVFSTATAQDTVVPWLSNRYLVFGNPSDSDVYGWSEKHVHFLLGQCAMVGSAFFAPNTPIYGIAAAVIIDNNGATELTDKDDIWGLLIAKDGSLMQHLDSVRWHYRSKPDRVWTGLDRVTVYPTVQEFYFDYPYILEDTFFVCVKRDKTNTSFSPDSSLLLGFREYYFHTHGNTQLHYCARYPHYDDNFYPGINTVFQRNVNNNIGTIDILPIIVPPDTDAVGCPPPSLRFIRALSGAPWFKYTLSTDEEVLEYQAIYSPLGCDDWDTIRPPSNPFKMGSNLDSTRYYKALFRTKHRHGCPIHDTVYWSPWSDTVLFYSGTTAPDTTNSIIPVVAETHAPFFTLTPNPTDGRVAVEVNSEELKDKSGEATITVCNATGREVLKQKASTLNSQLSTLNLEALPAGTYFVTVTIGGQSGTRKLVVK